jgi:hypothetical protein
MSTAGRTALETLVRILKAETGIPAAVSAVSVKEGVRLDPIRPPQVVMQQIAADLAEHNPGVEYPAVYVYCEKFTNSLQEKFRRFSGKVDLAIEIRVTHDRVEELFSTLQLYVEAVLKLLEGMRGPWCDGVFHGGEYQVTFSSVRKGGRHYLQSAKVSLPVHVSL